MKRHKQSTREKGKRGESFNLVQKALTVAELTVLTYIAKPPVIWSSWQSRLLFLIRSSYHHVILSPFLTPVSAQVYSAPCWSLNMKLMLTRGPWHFLFPLYRLHPAQLSPPPKSGPCLCVTNSEMSLSKAALFPHFSPPL